MKIQKLVGTVILLAGVALLIVGLTLQVPGTYLTTYASLDGAAIDGDTASSIREYVGGSRREPETPARPWCSRRWSGHCISSSPRKRPAPFPPGSQSTRGRWDLRSSADCRPETRC